MAVAAFAATLGRPNNPDTLWHVAVGRWILAHHALPDINTFYYSATAGFGYDYSWLSQVILFGAHRFSGGTGIAILNSVLAGLVFYLLYKLLERSCTNIAVNLIVPGVALLTIAASLYGRPVIFTVTFFTLEVLILSSFVQSRTWLLWLIPPLIAVWANLHAGFPIGLLAILAFLPLGQTGRDRWEMAGCLATGAAAIILNPYGWRMYLMPLETARALPMLRGLSEWTGVSGWEAVVWGILVAAVACGLSLRRQPLPLVLLTAVSAAAAGVSNRNMPLFGVVAVFTLSHTLLPILAPIARRSRLIRVFDMQPRGAGGWLWALAIPLLLTLAVRLDRSPVDLRFDFSGYPTAAVRYVEQHGCPDNLFVRETWSGYVLWAMPNRRLFYDAKGGFSREAATAHRELVRPRTGWRRVADSCGISTFLLERGTPLAVVLGEAAGWRREYSDSLAEVFVRVPGCSAPPTDAPPGAAPCAGIPPPGPVTFQGAGNRQDWQTRR